METILIAGGSGLIGKKIIKQLDKKKYIIHVLSRKQQEDYANVRFFQWDLKKQTIEAEAVKVDHIINLTGAGIADKKWTVDRKKLLISSRVDAANLIASTLKKINHRPLSYIAASAIGYYGDSKDQLMEESDLPVDDSFLSECTVAWEEASKNLIPLVLRNTILRIGIVLSNEGGAYAKMILPFKGGIASYFGDGSMQYSWIHIDDMVNLFLFAIQHKTEGVYNAVAPNPVTNKELIRSIRNKRTGFSLLAPVPVAALRLAMGEMADVVLSSTLVSSKKIQERGFKFKYETINQAIQALQDASFG